jgi:hypothetical protein
MKGTSRRRNLVKVHSGAFKRVCCAVSGRAAWRDAAEVSPAKIAAALALQCEMSFSILDSSPRFPNGKSSGVRRTTLLPNRCPSCRRKGLHS